MCSNVLVLLCCGCPTVQVLLLLEWAVASACVASSVCCFEFAVGVACLNMVSFNRVSEHELFVTDVAGGGCIPDPLCLLLVLRIVEEPFLFLTGWVAVAFLCLCCVQCLLVCRAASATTNSATLNARFIESHTVPFILFRLHLLTRLCRTPMLVVVIRPFLLVLSAH